MADIYEEIRRETSAGRLGEALRRIDAALAERPNDAYLIYLKGNACMKRGDWGGAISLFLQAERIDPQGPAGEARRMLDDIMSFYNKDMYNQ